MKLELSSKCGEIYRNGPTIFTFACIQCNQMFNSTKEIFSHIEKHYSQKDNDKDDHPMTSIPNKLDDDLSTVVKWETNDDSVEFSYPDYPVENEYIQDHHQIEECYLSTQIEDSAAGNVAKIEEKLPKSRTLARGRKSKKSNEEKRSGSEFSNKIIKKKNVSKYSCSACDKVLSSKTLLKSHMKYKHKIASVNERDTKPTADTKLKFELYEVITVNKNDIVECDFCGKKLKKRSIRDHLDIHSTEQKFTCTICNKKIQTRPSLKLHEKSHQTKTKSEKDIKKFSCDICGWMFRDRCNLMVHLRRHRGEKPYKCKVCGKGFSQSSYINVHMRGHTGEAPYKCTMCTASFKGNSALHYHIRIKHTKTRPYKCGVCDRSYSHSRSLREHQRTHTGERPYMCNVCNSNFSRRNAFEQHILLHTGIKSYKCKYCDMSFTQFAGRASHIKSAHKLTEDENKTIFENI